MKCPHCMFETPAGAKFCNECGQKLEIACSECGWINPPGSKFCIKCGDQLTHPPSPQLKELSIEDKIEKIQRYLPEGITEKILAQRDRIEGEYKQVTVMFCDMEGFTSLSERLGPEDTYSIMDEIYEILIHKVHDYEGTVNEMTGDGIMALFGAPIALEDAPQRAIRSAYSIHREIAKFNDKMKQERESIPPVKMRIGIHSGPVVVGTLGNDLRVEFKAVGDTVNLASRMEGMAEPGATYMSEETFKLTEGLFRVEALGELEVKGKEEAVKTYRVIAPSTWRTRFDVSAERGLTPFVGRQRELELLLDAFERAKEGRGQVVSIIASAGEGKSRLLYEFRKAIATDDVTFLEGKCLSYSRGVAYHPVIDILKSNFHIREGDVDSEIRKKVQRGLKVAGVEEASTLPYILELLSVKASGIDKLSLNPEARKVRTIEALNRNLLKGSEIRPVIIAVEDLHWIDESSEERIKSLVECISGARVLLIFTYRTEFVHTWGGRSYYNQITLNRIANREILAMVSHLLGTKVEISRDLEKLILEKTEGIPFFIEEFVKSLTDLKIIGKKGNKYHLVKDIRDVIIPSTVQDVIMARIDSLPEGSKGILQTGSVVGREFSHDLIKMVTGLSERELLSHLLALKDSELIYERGIHPQSTYIFKHALTQGVAYGSILQKRRRTLHARIVEALEALSGDRFAEQVDRLAHHAFQGEVWGKAVAYFRQAGKNSIEHSANHEAVFCFEQALSALEHLPQNNDTMEQGFNLLSNLRGPLLDIGAFDRMSDSLHESERLAELLDDPSRLGRVKYGWATYFWRMGDYDRVLTSSQHALSLAMDCGDVRLQITANFSLGLSYFGLGDYGAAIEVNRRNLVLCDADRRYERVGEMGLFHSVLSRMVLAMGLAEQGAFVEGMAYGKEGVRISKAAEHIGSLVRIYWAIGHLLILQGDFSQAIPRLENGLTLCKKAHIQSMFPYIAAHLGYAYALNGRIDEALPLLEQAEEQAISMRTLTFHSLHVVWLSDTYRLAGRLQEATDHSGRAIELSHTHKECGSRAWALRLLGDLAGQNDPSKVEEAADHYRQALALADELGMQPLQAHCHNGLGTLYSQIGQVEQADAELSMAVRLYRDMGMTFWLPRAEAALADLERR